MQRSFEASSESAQPRVTSQDIARRAHEMWVAAGRPAGLELNFWLSAELFLTHPPAQRSPRPSRPHQPVHDRPRSVSHATHA